MMPPPSAGRGFGLRADHLPRPVTAASKRFMAS
jgi:hypothetical protein